MLRQTLRREELFLLDAAVESTPPAARIRPRSIARLSRVLASLLESGLPLTRAIASVAQTAPAGEAEVLKDVRSRVEKGSSFAEAVGAHPAFFPPLFAGVARAGERSGSLGMSLARFAAHAETEAELRQKLVSATVYPALLLVSGSLSVAVLLFWVLPRFGSLLSDAGATLPTSTRLMLGVSSAVQVVLPFTAPALLLALVGGTAILTTRVGREAIHIAILRLPGIGQYRRTSVGAKFARIMAVLLRGGTPVLEALRLTANTFRDPIVRDEIQVVHDAVRDGGRLNVAMSRSPLYPPVLVDLARFGEESARLPEYLERAAEMLEGNNYEITRRITSLAEPLMIIFFGGVIGVVALSLLQAIYGLNAGAMR